MTLSKYFKYRGYDKDTNKKMLTDWISKQSEEYYGSKYYRYSWEDILNYIDEINDTTYKNNYRFIDRIEVPVTIGEMKEINMLKNKSDKLVAFTMMFLSKIYGNEDGEFYYSYSKLSKLSSVKERQVFNSINNLQKYAMIEIVQRNKIKKSISVERGYKVYKYPNTYRILFKGNDVIIGNITSELHLIYDFYKIYKECVFNHGFNVSYRFKEQIEKYCGE